MNPLKYINDLRRETIKIAERTNGFTEFEEEMAKWRKENRPDAIKSKDDKYDELREKYDIRGNVTSSKIRRAKRRDEMREQVVIQGSGQFGNIVDKTGLYMLHGSESKPEFILDNQAAAVFMKAATLLSGSQVMAQNGMGSGSPVIINNVDNSQRNPVVSNQATQIKVPDNPRPSDPTMLAVQGSQMFN